MFFRIRYNFGPDSNYIFFAGLSWDFEALKPFVLKGKVLVVKLGESAKKCEKSVKNSETILPFSRCLTFRLLWGCFVKFVRDKIWGP